MAVGLRCGIKALYTTHGRYDKHLEQPYVGEHTHRDQEFRADSLCDLCENSCICPGQSPTRRKQGFLPGIEFGISRYKENSL